MLDTSTLDLDILAQDWLHPEEVKYLLMEHSDEQIAERLALIDKKLTMEENAALLPSRELQANWWRASIFYYGKQWENALQVLEKSHLPLQIFPKKYFFQLDIRIRCLIYLKRHQEALQLLHEGFSKKPVHAFDHFMLLKSLSKNFKTQDLDIPLSYVDIISQTLEQIGFQPLPVSKSLTGLVEACNQRNKFENSLYASLMLTLAEEKDKLTENLEKFISESQIGYYQAMARKKIAELNGGS